jgi:hypothetical protein
MIITAAITAAVAFVARLCGVKLSASALIGVAVTVKIILVVLGMWLSARLLRAREAQKQQEKAGADPVAAAPDADEPGAGKS